MSAVAAAGSWTPLSVELGPACDAARVLAIGADGRMLAASTGCDDSARAATVLGVGRSGTPFRRAGQLAGRISSALQAADGGWLLTGNGRGLRVFDVTRTGRVSGSERLTEQPTRFSDVASSRSGMAAGAWVTRGRPRVLVRVRRAGSRRFGPQTTLATFPRDGTAGGVAVAVGRRGDVAVLWAAGRAVHARTRAAGARRFGPARRVGASDTRAAIAPVYSPGGRLSVIWSSSDGGEQQDRPARLRVAVLRPGERHFAGSLLPGVGISSELLFRSPAPRAVWAGDRVLVGYTGADTGVQVAELTARGTLAHVRTLDPRGNLEALAGSRSGAALVTWTQYPETFDDPRTLPFDARLHAAVRDPAGRFGAAEAVAPQGTVGAGAVLDPAGAHAVVGWRSVDPASPAGGMVERTLP
jgi:hypothetical protein